MEDLCLFLCLSVCLSLTFQINTFNKRNMETKKKIRLVIQAITVKTYIQPNQTSQLIFISEKVIGAVIFPNTFFIVDNVFPENVKGLTPRNAVRETGIT